jgi:hypothetical protein
MDAAARSSESLQARWIMVALLCLALPPEDFREALRVEAIVFFTRCSARCLKPVKRTNEKDIASAQIRTGVPGFKVLCPYRLDDRSKGLNHFAREEIRTLEACARRT